MKLMEEKYTPKTLEDIISPKSTDLLLQLSSLLREQKNILFIGTNNTFKSIAMRLAMEEYYDGNQKIQSWSLILSRTFLFTTTNTMNYETFAVLLPRKSAS